MNILKAKPSSSDGGDNNNIGGKNNKQQQAMEEQNPLTLLKTIKNVNVIVCFLIVNINDINVLLAKELEK